MLTPDHLKKVRRIEITTRKLVTDVMTGRYRSHFKGQGMQFAEHRIYTPGDDVRHIDWKVSARTREPLLKKFEEERELNVLLIVDMSKSLGFGHDTKTKLDIQTEIAGMLAFAATLTGDKVGCILVTDQVEKVILPKKGRNHVQNMITQLFTHLPISKKTNLVPAFDMARKVMKHSGVIFVLSDFLTEGFEQSLKRLTKKHEVVAIRIRDRNESEPPKLGTLYTVHPETGEEYWIPTNSYRFQDYWAKWKEKDENTWKDLSRLGSIERLDLSTKEDAADLLLEFMGKRNKK